MAPELDARQIVTQTAQALPSWLSYSAFPATGGPTSYTILRFPLTYYGPSIPLGTEGVWTYGGLTRPPTSATLSATQTPTVTTSPTSLSTITTSPTTSLPTSTLSSSATRPTTTTFASVSISTRTRTSSTAPPTSTSTAPAGSRGSLPVVAIVLIALGIAAALLLCCLAAALFWRRRKARRREPLRGDSEFYAGPGPDDDAESIHAVPNLAGERNSLLGGDSFIVVGNRNGRPLPMSQMSQRSLGGASYQRLAESRVSQVSRRTGSDEIGVAYTDLPPPRSRRRTVTAVSGGVSSSPSHPTSSSQPGIGSMRTHNGSQRSSLFQHPAEQDESPVLPRDSAHGMVKRASDLGEKPLQAPAPAAQGSTSGATLGAELGMLGLGTRYPDPSQSLLATSSSGGSGARFPPRLVTPVASSFGSGSRVSRVGGDSRPPSQFVAAVGSQASRASRGHSPEPSPRASPPLRDTLSWPDSPESEHDEGAQLLTAERGNVRSGIGLLGRFSWFTRGGNGNGSSAPAPRASRHSYPGWMSPPTEEGFLAEADTEHEHESHTSPSDPPTLESRPPPSHPGMVRLVPRERSESSGLRPVSGTSGNSVYHDAPSQPASPRERSGPSTWLGFLGRGSPVAGPAPPVPQRPSPLSHHPSLIPVAPSSSLAPPQLARTRAESDVGPISRPRTEPVTAARRITTRPASSRPESDILDRPAPESLLDLPPPTLVPPSPSPVFPPGLTRLPRTYNFGLLNELGDEPPAAEEQWQHLRSSPEHVDWRRVSMGRTVRINSPHVATTSQTGSVHNGGTASPTVTDPTSLHVPRATGSNSSRSHSGGSDNSESRRAVGQTPSMSAMTVGTTYSVSTSGTGTPADTTTVSSHPYPAETLVTESFEFGGYGFGYADSEYDEYETRATTVSSNDSSGRRAVDLHGEMEDETDGQDVYVGRFGQEGGPRFIPPMSAVGLSGWGQPRADGNSGRT
ncbi:unnamed protein product [Rhizoctonia solani]|nr:unnamed protein product [Rhizoctonia solani]CAE6537472.1 unnamed protein product [Rhizoctonia solani]